MLAEVNNVSRTYTQNNNAVHALKDVDLKLEKGEFICLLGPSGCGKTTLLNILAGFDSASEGSVSVNGKSVTIFQNYGLLPWHTVRKNIEFGLEAKRLPRKEIHTRSKEYLDLVGLTVFAKHHPHQLSGGMRQRASIACALAVNPEIIFMDEPLGALDALTRMNMQDELLRIWREQNMTIVMVTHDVDEAVYLSDKVVVMTPRPGKIEKIINIELSRPRARSNPEFLKYRTQILKLLNLGGNIAEPNYYL